MKKNIFGKHEIIVRNEAAELIPQNSITELVFIIDKSGSMSGLEKDTIGGFNSLIRKQKKESGECYVSTVLFSDRSEVVHDRLPLSEITEMTEDDYITQGCTALIDAIGGAIKHISAVHRYNRKEDIPQRTLFVITTDGMENASRKFRANEVKKMIKSKEKDGWEFLFIGANIDSVETAGSFGIRRDRAVNYHADSRGTGVLYEAVCRQVSNLRKCKSVSNDWSRTIDEDYNSR